MTTTGGPQDAVPQDAVPDESPARPPAPPAGPALRRLLALHVGLLLALVVAATAIGDDSCDGRGAWCFTRGAMFRFALLAGGFNALLSMIGGGVTVLLLARRVRGTGTRVVVGVVGGVTTLLLAWLALLSR